MTPLIKAFKIANFESKYLGQFWALRGETFCVIIVRMKGGATFITYDYVGTWKPYENLNFVINFKIIFFASNF